MKNACTAALLAILGNEVTGQECQNLLENGGCETAISGPWTQAVGTWSCTITINPATTPEPHGGAYHFFAEKSELGVLRQDVAISPIPGQDFQLTGYVASADQHPSDTSEIRLQFLNASGVVLLSKTSGPLASKQVWTKVSLSAPAPVGTKIVRVELESFRHNGDNNDGYYDDLVLVALPVSGGQANSAAAALALNAPSLPTGSGPFDVSVEPGSNLTIMLDGPTGQLGLLLVGSHSGAVASGCSGFLEVTPILVIGVPLGTFSTVVPATVPIGTTFGVQGAVTPAGACPVPVLSASYCVIVT